MAKVGRPRKPTALKALEGNRSRRDLVKPAHVPSDNVRMMTGTAKEYFDYFMPIAKAIGALTNADNGGFKIMCELLGEYDLLRLRMNEHDGSITDDQYERMSNRMIKIAPLILRYLDRFGLTPSGRADIGSLLPKSEEESEFERIRKLRQEAVSQ